MKASKVNELLRNQVPQIAGSKRSNGVKVNDLLSIVEVSCVDLILGLSRLHVILESPEVFLAELSLGSRLETFIKRRLLSLVVLCVDGRARRLRKRLAKKVLRFDLGHVTLVAWDVLRLQVLCGTTKPILSLL